MVVRAISRTFDVLGLNAIMRRLTRNRIAVLMYHGLVRDDDVVDAWTFVRVSQFEQQMRHLKCHYDVVSLRQALAEGPTHSSRKRVVITFDDGYASNYHLAFPILKQCGFPATIFIATSFVESCDMFWYDKISAVAQLFEQRSIDLSRWGLGVYPLSKSAPEQRWAAVQRLLTRLKEEPAYVREEIADTLLHSVGGKDVANLEAFKPLSPAMIREMKASGLIEIGSHTHRHELLVQHDDSEVIGSLRKASALLTRWSGDAPRSFSYPNGDYDNRVKTEVMRAGHDCALTTRSAEWQAGSDPYEIPRLGIGAYHTEAEFSVKASGNGEVLGVLWNLFARGRVAFQGE